MHIGGHLHHATLWQVALAAVPIGGQVGGPILEAAGEDHLGLRAQGEHRRENEEGNVFHVVKGWLVIALVACSI